MAVEKKKEFIINVVFYAAIGILVFAVCKYLLPVLLPFLFAFLVAAMIQLPINRLTDGKEEKRKLLSVLSCIAFYTVVFAIIFFVGSKAVKFIVNAVISAPSFYYEKVLPMLTEISDWISWKVAPVDAEASAEIKGIFAELSQNMGQYISEFSVKVLKWFSGTVAGIPGFIVKTVITIVSTFFMAADFPKVVDFFDHMIPGKWRDGIKWGKNYAWNVAAIYLRSYVILFF